MNPCNGGTVETGRAVGRAGNDSDAYEMNAANDCCLGKSGSLGEGSGAKGDTMTARGLAWARRGGHGCGPTLQTTLWVLLNLDARECVSILTF
jgi:hypothetical protein